MGDSDATSGPSGSTIFSPPPRLRRFLQVTQVLVVVAVVVGLGYVIVSALVQGPPGFPDPLTTRGVHVVGPGNFSYFSGSITGEDYVTGNYTVLNPPGAFVGFAVYNTTGMIAYVHHQPARPLWNQSGEASGRIVFAAPYTDVFYFVFVNPYPASTGITLNVYVTTTYQSNVVIG